VSRATQLMLGAVAVAASAGCAAAQSGAASRPTAAPTAGFSQQVTPFAVHDSSGSALGFPFLGGLDHPRPQLADIDGDGDPDLFVQEYTGRMKFFENQGGGRFEWRSDHYHDLDVGEWSRFADADADGDLDLFVETPFSYIGLLRNEGSARQPRFVPAADTLRDTEGKAIFSDRQNIPQIVDLDCDGRLDLLLGRASGMVTHYEATAPAGSAPVPRFAFVTDSFQNIQIIGETFTPTRHGANTMIVDDVDEDGDPDILWGDFYEPGLLWLVNRGTCERPVIGRDTIPFPQGDPIATSGWNAPALADVDGDGDRDLLVGVLGGAFNAASSARANLWYLERTGPQSFARRATAFLGSLDVGAEASPALVDLDGDADLDLVVGNKVEPSDPNTAALHVYENRGTTSAPSFHAAGRLPVTGHHHMVPAFGDLDDDGDPDLVVGTWRDALLYYRNDGSSREPSFVLADSALVKLTRGSYATPALADLDGDGDLDLLAGESSGALNVWRNVGTATVPRFELLSDEFGGLSAGRRSAPAAGDVDGDGDVDLVLGGESGAMLFPNGSGAGDPQFPTEPSARFRLPPLVAPALGDLDGDGDLDLVVGTTSGGIVYLENGGQ
jgi:hypothetical protein